MPRYKIITAGTPMALERAVESFLSDNDGWKPEGGPREDLSRGNWIQAVVSSNGAMPPGEIRLKEPKRR